MSRIDTTTTSSHGGAARERRRISDIQYWLSLLVTASIVVVAFAPADVHAQETCVTVSSSGDWSDSSVWEESDSNGNAQGTPCPTADGYPNADDNAIIGVDDRIVLDVDLTSSGEGPLASLELLSGATTDSDGTALFQDGFSIGVTGDVENNSSGKSNGLFVFDSRGGSADLFVGGNLKNGDSSISEVGNLVASDGCYVDVGGAFSNNGDVDINNSVLSLGGNFTNTGTSFDSDGSTVIFTGSSQSLSSSGTIADGSADIEFSSIVVEGGTVVDPSIDVRVKDSLTVKLMGTWGQGESEDADFIMSGREFSVAQDGGTPSNSGAFFSGSIVFDGSNLSNLPVSTVTVSGQVFSAVNVSTIVDLDGTFTINGPTIITSGWSLTVDTNELLRLNDDGEINGTLTANGTLSFGGQGNTTEADGDNIQDIIGTGDFIFSSVETTGAGTDVLLNPNEATAIDVGTLFIASDTDLRVAGNLDVGNNMTVDGGFGFSGTDDGVLTFDGGSEQTLALDSPLSIRELVLANSSGNQAVILSGTLEIRTRLSLSNGEFDVSGGTLVLFSGEDDDNVDRHAVIEYGDGDLTGPITAQREFETGPDWYFTANPSGTSYDEILRTGGTNQLWIQGVPGSDVPIANRPNTNLFVFNESADVAVQSDDGAWETPGGMSNTATRGAGFIVYPFSDDDNDGDPDGFPKVIDNVSSVPQSPTFDFTVTATERPSDGNSTIDAEEGWNLLGNPYLTNLSWDALYADSKTNDIDNVVYVYSPLDGYEIYNGGSGSPSTTNNFTDGIIAPFQAFFVKVSEVASPSPSFGISDITNVQTITGSDEFFKSKTSTEETREIAFNLELAGVEKATRLTFRRGGEFQKDKSDAYNLNAPFSSGSVLEIFSVLDNGYGLAINNLPYNISSEIEIPISVSAAGCDGSQPFGGTATITWPTYRNIPSSAQFALIDTQTGQSVDLQATNEYTFELDSSTSPSECSSNRQEAKSGEQIVPAPPTPEVSQVAVEKSGGGIDARFLLAIENLPVELGNFTGSAVDGGVELQWTTLSETDNSGFQVQQKREGEFQDVSAAFVEGAGTTNQPQEYSFRVKDVGVGKHTFRLKQVDLDGAPEYSDEVTVQVGLDGNYALNAYPNPVSERARVDFSVKESQDVTVELYNTLGQRVRVIHQGSIPSNQMKSVQVSAEGLASGLYIVRMRGETFSTTQSLTVVK
jgi:hypothetical protein